MLLSEAIFVVLFRLNWKNILLLNANEEDSTCLLRLLNNAGRPVTVVDQKEMSNFSWPERMDIRTPIDGFVLVAEERGNLTGILSFLQDNHMIIPRHPWIIGIAGRISPLRITSFFKEGDRAVVMESDTNQTNAACFPQNEDVLLHKEIEYAAIFESTSVWTLRSPGNGSIYFEKRDASNVSSANQLFDKPIKNFWGRTLKISSLASPPIIIPPEKGEKRWHGYIFRIINTLADAFNFTYTVKEADNRLYGISQEDGSWSGMIGELITQTVDIGAGDLSWTLERALVVDLTSPVFPEIVTFIYRAPTYYSRTWILFQGIQPKVWIGMTSATLAAFAMYSLSLALHQKWLDDRIDTATVCVESADESISTLYRALLGKGVVHIPFHLSCRTVLGTWFGGSLILSCLYGGSLTSKLSSHRSPKPADSLSDLLKMHPDAQLALRNNSQIHQFFKKSSYWNKVWLKNMQKHVIPGQIKISETMQRVHNSSSEKAPYVWIAERSMLVKLMQNYSDNPVVCDLYVAKDSIVKSDWSIALQRDSPFFAQVNEMITRMARFGLLERWRREYWESATGSCHPTDGLNASAETAISFDDTRAIFFVLAIGWAVGIAVFIMERRGCNSPHF